MGKLVVNKIIPATKNYHSFLKSEYIQVARENVSILELPNGAQCYQAYIRKYTLTNKTGKEIFELGQKTVSVSKTEIETLGQELYNTNNFDEIITNINKDASNYLKSSNKILETTKHLMTKAEKECSHWFSILPKSTVTMKPYEV